jgi:hypothetical protein
MARWSINLDLEDPDVEPIRNSAAELLASERAGVITEIHPDGSHGPSMLVLDIDGSSPAGALQQANSIWAQLRAHAGLSPQPARVGFLVGPMDQPSTFHDELLARARGRIVAKQFDHAVITAQTAFEVYIRGLLHDLSRSVMPDQVAVAVQPQSAALRDRSSKALLEALIGKRITESDDLWKRYDQHAIKRNGVVHAGATMEEADAEESVDVVRQLIKWIDTAAHKHT